MLGNGNKDKKSEGVDGNRVVVMVQPYLLTDLGLLLFYF